MKYALQIILLVLVYWLVFIQLGKPYNKSTFQDQNPNSNSASQVPINFITNTSIVLFFLLYATYFYLSALQLKYGYREIKMRNSLFENYSQLTYTYAKVMYATPFLYQLKVLMDWTFLPTSLDIWQWFKLEDISGLLFFSKIQAQGYIDRPVGERINIIQKGSLGCSLVTLILACIFGPLLIFSTLNPTAQLDLIESGYFEISLSNSLSGLSIPVYQSNQLYGLMNQIPGNEIQKRINFNVTSSLILEAPTYGALQEFQLPSYSNNNWDITKPLFSTLLQQLNDGNYSSHFFFNVTYYFNKQNKAIIPTKNQFCYPQNPSFIDEYPPQNQSGLSDEFISMSKMKMDNCNAKVSPVLIPYFYIETMQIYSPDGTNLKPRPIIKGAPGLQNITVSLNCTDSIYYWNFNYSGISPSMNITGATGMIFFLTSQKESSLFTGYSITTIYTSIILLIATFVQSFFSGQVWLFEYSESMKPDDLLMICQAISIARSQKDFVKENILYYELIDIMRQPEIVKIMSGSWSQVQKQKYIKQRQDEDLKKEKQD